MQGGQILQNAGNGMFQVVQPMQTVTVDGQEALFIPNMGASANQLNGAQPIQIGNQQAFLTPNGQIIRPGVMPANILQNMGQTVSLPTGKFTISLFSHHQQPVAALTIRIEPFPNLRMKFIRKFFCFFL